MFKSLQLKDISLVVILLLTTVGISYFYANTEARNRLWQSIYPVRAQLALQHVSCSESSPSWMIDILIEKTKYQNAPANQIAYIDPQGQLYHCESGYVDGLPLLSDPISADTRFRYASVTKLWTADAILDLIKEERLTLEMPLAELLPEIDQPKDARVNDITIKQLLMHQGGFNRLDIQGNDMFGIGEPVCPNSIETMNNIKLSFTPGAQTSYSNLGYCLLGAVVEQVSGQPYQDYLQAHYDIDAVDIQFISSKRLDDEISYNYTETGLTGISDIYTAFNYEDLYSVAGLSGNAVALAQQSKAMSAKRQPNILSVDADMDCDISKLGACYGYAMMPYQDDIQSATVHFRDGTLLGLSSLVAIDEAGGVVALLSNGTPTDIEHSNDTIKTMIYEHLSKN
ncbi:serine hydrolase domain-containing protein [Psychrobacter sp.]|uniref:serine hydrolase domain-containing protein n=1 Tax=Psychrobacter sp. TaxID=56811 RepID=UPI0030012660|tara:strand:+ start:620 stop:1813 length:1194 start_codon:yes stop_codon:yes gene_type:complete